MKIKFFAYFRDPEFASRKEADLSGPATVRELGFLIGELYGERFLNEFFTPDRSGLGEKIIVLINGRHVEFLGGIDAPLKDSDTVSLFPVVAGG